MTLTTLLGWIAAGAAYAGLVILIARCLGANHLEDDQS